MDPKQTLQLNAHPATNGVDAANKLPVLPPKLKGVHSRNIPKLKGLECFCVLLVFVFWLALFSGGITVDTRPSRCLISAGGVSALEDAVKYAQSPCPQFEVVTKTMLFRASGIILLWFLPLNLALICASAAVLGTFGNRADLSDDASPRPSQDDTNPYVSAMLRGFFVYLIMISGLLVLDINPFSNPSPAQYIRLAGFLSLFGFVLSYQPRLFRGIIVWIYQRIAQAEGPGRGTPSPGITVQHDKDIHETRTIHLEPAAAEALAQPSPAATNEASAEKVKTEPGEESST